MLENQLQMLTTKMPSKHYATLQINKNLPVRSLEVHHWISCDGKSQTSLIRDFPNSIFGSKAYGGPFQFFSPDAAVGILIWIIIFSM